MATQVSDKCGEAIRVSVGSAGELVALFEEVADEQCWQPGKQIAENATKSVHFALWVGSDLAGGLQLVQRGADSELPCQRVWPDITLPKSCAHVTVLAIKAEHRGNIALFWTLCQELWCYCAERRIDTLVLESTPRMAVLYRRLGLPLRQIGEERIHWGEPCGLYAVDIVSVAGTVVLRAMKSPLFRSLVDSALRRAS